MEKLHIEEPRNFYSSPNIVVRFTNYAVWPVRFRMNVLNCVL